MSNYKSSRENEQTASSENNYNAPVSVSRRKRSFVKKYKLSPSLTNKYGANVSNPTVQPDGKTEMGVPIPDKLNTEFSKEYQEENEL